MWAKRIGDALSIPDNFGWDDFPSEWSKPMNHAAPGGPLEAALIDKTQGALYAIYSGVLIWAARRLERMTNIRALEDLAVMLFCYQQDPDYLFAGQERPRILASSRAEKYKGTEIYLRYLIFYQFWNNGVELASSAALLHCRESDQPHPVPHGTRSRGLPSIPGSKASSRA